MSSFDSITTNFNRMERNEITNKHIKAIYCNTCFSFFNFLIMFIIAIQLGPVVKDAGILINDASTTLHDFSIIVPDVQRLMPEARNTTLILGRMIPSINQGMSILNQICTQMPKCHL